MTAPKPSSSSVARYRGTMSLWRSPTRFEPDTVVAFSCRHCRRPAADHRADGACYAPLLRMLPHPRSNWRA
jgi:hypothetical protein